MSDDDFKYLGRFLQKGIRYMPQDRIAVPYEVLKHMDKLVEVSLRETGKLLSETNTYAIRSEALNVEFLTKKYDGEQG